eukprot:648055-Rhodomonas_salina.2
MQITAPLAMNIFFRHVSYLNIHIFVLPRQSLGARGGQPIARGPYGPGTTRVAPGSSKPSFSTAHRVGP